MMQERPPFEGAPSFFRMTQITLTTKLLHYASTNTVGGLFRWGKKNKNNKQELKMQPVAWKVEPVEQLTLLCHKQAGMCPVQ